MMLLLLLLLLRHEILGLGRAVLARTHVRRRGARIAILVHEVDGLAVLVDVLHPALAALHVDEVALLIDVLHLLVHVDGVALLVHVHNGLLHLLLLLLLQASLLLGPQRDGPVRAPSGTRRALGSGDSASASCSRGRSTGKAGDSASGSRRGRGSSINKAQLQDTTPSILQPNHHAACRQHFHDLEKAAMPDTEICTCAHADAGHAGTPRGTALRVAMGGGAST
mmetsp:Transcript_39845/g.106210  ORF Transcript_39845/g.106210 Transcript_39845/m.106210 type:complete len:224 (+) Transcript_39845:661-1332(+)